MAFPAVDMQNRSERVERAEAARRQLADRLIERSGLPAVNGAEAASDRERLAQLRRVGGAEPA